MNKELAENLYYKEEERKAELLNLLNFVLAILGLALGLFAFYVNSALSSVSPADQTTSICIWCYRAFIAFLVADFVCIATAVVFVIRAFHNHTYQYLPSPGILKQYYDGLLSHYQGTQASNADQLAIAEFDDYLLGQFVAAAERNDGLNQRRKKFIHLATRFCIASITLLGLTFIPFVFTGKSDCSSTKITGFGEALTVRLQGEGKQGTTAKEIRNDGLGTRQPGKLETKPRQSESNATTKTAAAAAPTNQRERGQDKSKDGLIQ